ncbi:MAG: hypothetical protein D8M52_09445 [Chlorobi bacterium]|jgi:hypothetical protein|nr:MAG: hypothetical protein F9K28_09930 [Bacteroidota bacterium]KXK36209.1 MAG: hypothetical protein UZ06_CHB003000011 [Chlorobi bacterium OLB6]MBE2265884.1 hypothetical protein [Flavobacteriales bacterium]MBL1161926.1 hypothetical protein [Chlorobiota bacterium]MBW7854452.1 hypothetical protein [Candidatus Kapabacteria bacterium]MCC6331987.1 hypothetical protein [Ignavibacteria bacterium]
MISAKHSVIQQLLSAQSGPCMSVYVHTHRTQPERRDDPARYRAMVRRLNESLHRAYLPEKIEEYLAPFHALLEDEDFWNARKEGIAVFSSPGFFHAEHLERPVPDTAVVAKSFHVKPLLRIMQTLTRYNVVTLTRDRIHVYEGDRLGLTELDLGPDVPLTLEAALGAEKTEQQTAHVTVGGSAQAVSSTSRQDEIDNDTERFYRIVDRELLNHVSHNSGLPLILVGLAKQIGIFQRVRKNPNVLLESVEVHPEGIAHKELVHRAWEIIEPYTTSYSKRLIEDYHTAAVRGLGADQIADIAKAAAEGRVAQLFVEASRQIPGTVDPVTGNIAFDDIDQPDINDALDDLAVLVLRKGGKVHVLESEHMPAVTGAAAVLRF